MIAYLKKHETDRIPPESWYRLSIAQLDSHFPDDAPGFFGPRSITWKIYREPGVLIASYRALLLQIAHPAVGAGVEIYSNFQEDYLGRAYRTFLQMASIYFGSCRLARKTAARLHQMHYRIKGTYTTATGEQKSFGANDPLLLTWILVTLVDSSIQAYELLCSPLTPAEKESFLRESQITAQLMGIPRGYFPTDYDTFQTYFNQTLQSNQLEVGTTAERLSKDILRGPFPLLEPTARLLATGLLPQELIEAYQLDWSKKHQLRFSKLMHVIKTGYRCWPKALRYAPPYYQALYRIAKSKKQKPKFLASFFNWLSRHFKAPFLIREFI